MRITAIERAIRPIRKASGEHEQNDVATAYEIDVVPTPLELSEELLGVAAHGRHVRIAKRSAEGWVPGHRKGRGLLHTVQVQVDYKNGSTITGAGKEWGLSQRVDQVTLQATELRTASLAHLALHAAAGRNYGSVLFSFDGDLVLPPTAGYSGSQASHQHPYPPTYGVMDGFHDGTAYFSHTCMVQCPSLHVAWWDVAKTLETLTEDDAQTAEHFIGAFALSYGLTPSEFTHALDLTAQLEAQPLQAARNILEMIDS